MVIKSEVVSDGEYTLDDAVLVTEFSIVAGIVIGTDADGKDAEMDSLVIVLTGAVGSGPEDTLTFVLPIRSWEEFQTCGSQAILSFELDSDGGDSSG